MAKVTESLRTSLVRTLRPSVYLTVGVLLAHCVPKTQTASQVRAFTTSDKYLWQKATLTACFDQKKYVVDKQDPSAEETVAAAITKEYTPEATSITITGFLPCTATSQADISVIFDNSIEGFGVANTVGAQPFVPPPDDKVFAGVTGHAIKISLKSIKEMQTNIPARFLAEGQTADQFNLAITALHEFGHIVGLQHEADHPDSTCKLKASQQDLEAMELQSPGTYVNRGPYDPYSIMSYCFDMALAGINHAKGEDPAIDKTSKDFKPGLSDGDKKTLKGFYSKLLPASQAPIAQPADSLQPSKAQPSDSLPPSTAQPTDSLQPSTKS